MTTASFPTHRRSATIRRRLVSFFSLFGLFAAVPAAFAQQTFVHPGGLHTQADLDRMKTQVAAGAHPWIDDWNKLIADSEAQNTYTASPQANMGVSRQRASADAHAAYLNAIRWYVSGDTSYADCAVRICNGWSTAVNQVPTGTDIPGLIGIPIAEFAYAGEILRLYPGWQTSDFTRYQSMMETYLYPVCHNFITNHNGTCDSHYWANWDLCNIGAIMGIGVLCDDSAKFNEAIQYYENGVGNGNILNAVYYVHPNGLGQWQESGRDQEHAQLGVGLAAAFCQMAWNQGVDLFSYANNRLLAGAEYVARTTLNQPVPYTTYNNCDNVNQYFLSSNGLGRLDDRPIWELLYNHFVVLQGMSAPNVTALAQLTRPEHGSADHFGYGTLTFTLNAAASPFPVEPVPAAPTGVTATPGVGQIFLNWAVPADNSAQGYIVQRGTSAAGPFATLATLSQTTWNAYADTTVTVGTTYYYQVIATNQTGTGPASATVSAAAVGATATLPQGWFAQDVGPVSAAGSATYGNVVNNTFIVSGSGTGIGGTADSCGLTGVAATGDVIIEARLLGTSGQWSKTGLMIRESLAPDAPMMVVKLGDTGDRDGGAGYRSASGGATSWVAGDDYTWLPTWFRLQRSGDTFTASQSNDGSNWVVVTTATIPMASTSYVSLVTCPGSSTGALLTSTFDNVSVVGTVLAGPPGNLSEVNGNSQVTLSWTASANASGYNVKRAATSGGPYTMVASGVTGTSYVDTGLTNWSTYYYVVTATEGSFESVNSNEVSGTPGDITDIWSSNAVSGNWSGGTNWVGGSAPTAAMSLAFGSSPITALTNDLSGLTITRLTFNSGAPAFTIGGNAFGVGGNITNSASSAETISAGIALNGARTINAVSGAITLAGVLSDGSASSGLTKLGSQTVTLTGANTFTGDVVHTTGTLTIAGIGTGTAGAPLSGALGRGRLQLGGGTLNSSAAATVYNNVVVQSGTTGALASNAANLTLAGNISGSGNLNESGANTGGTHLSGDNSGFAGTFSSNNATNHRVRFDAATSGSANATWVLNNSQTDGYGLTFGNATISFGALSGNGVFRNDSSASTTTSIVSIGALNTNTSFGGVMVSNSGRAIAVTKVGTGTLTFTGAHTYTGPTTVTSGTLLINGSIASATNVIGGAFGGTGKSTAAVTVGTGLGTGAMLVPGSNGIGTFTTTGALTLNADATFAVELNSTSGSADKVSAGSVTINNATLTLTELGGGSLAYGTVLTIVDNAGTGAVVGTFKGLSEGALLTGGANYFRISYVGGTGNDVVLTAVVPPPAITSAASADATVGVPFSYQIAATNSPTRYSASGLPAGLTLDAATGILSGTPTTAGTVSATIGVANATGSATAPLTIAVGQGTATIAFAGLAETYTGNPAVVTPTTVPGGLAVSIAYAGNATPPTNAGSYAVTATVNDPNYIGTATDTLVIAKAAPTIAVAAYAVSYDGNAHGAGGTATGVNGELLAGLNLTGTVHTDAGTYNDGWTFTDATGNYSDAAGGVVDSIAQAAAAVSVSGYSLTYDGNTHTATGSAIGVKGESLSGLNLAGTTHTNAGTYNDAWSFADPNGNYRPASGTVSDAIVPASATISVTPYRVTYDGNTHTATGTATGAKGETLAGLDLSGTTHTNVGTYNDVWTFADAMGNYANANGAVADTITAATPTVSVKAYSVTYDGSEHMATGSVTGAKGESLAGLDLRTTAHTNAGTYNDEWTFADATGNYANAAGTVKDMIAPAPASIAFAPLTQAYDGTAKSVTASTTPAGLKVDLAYDGSAAAPIVPGSHVVVGTIDDANYTGSTTANFTITVTALMRHALSLDGEIDGSAQVVLPEADVLNSKAAMSGDLLVSGTPTPLIGNHTTYGSTIDYSGALVPSGYAVSLNGYAVLRHIGRRVDAADLPAVATPPAPTGTVAVTLSAPPSSPIDFTTISDLTLNPGAGSIAVPPGTYGTFTAFSGTTLVVGVAGSTDPVAYNLRSLALNGGAQLQVVGPVILTLASGATVAGVAGNADHPTWLSLQVASGGVNLSGVGTILHGLVLAPTGLVQVNAHTILHGRVTADQLTVGASGLIKE